MSTGVLTLLLSMSFMCVRKMSFMCNENCYEYTAGSIVLPLMPMSIPVISPMTVNTEMDTYRVTFVASPLSPVISPCSPDTSPVKFCAFPRM